MQRSQIYSQKNLNFTYEEYVGRGKSLQNLIIDKYVIYQQIGKGSNGQVYKGMNDQTKNLVAVKLMNLKQINAEQKITVKLIKQRLCESQPKLMQQCNSPNLIKCYDIYRNEDLKILILQYCNGQTLQKQIDQKKRIPENQAVQIIKHIINGLMELHRNKIIHRDLKAQNIMSHNGTYKIIDFGFSKKLQIAQQNAQIRGTALGTITTMAPQVMSKKPYGLKADIWSLGIIFFQMIYGVYPYDSMNAFALYQEIKTKKIFNKENSPTINGYKPTQSSYDFIKFLIVFDTDQRPDWKKVSQHSLITGQNQQINQRFIKKVQVVVKKGISQAYQIQNSYQSQIDSKNSMIEQDYYDNKNERQIKQKQQSSQKNQKQQYQVLKKQNDSFKQEQKIQEQQIRNNQQNKIKFLQKTLITIKKGQLKPKQQNKQPAYEAHQINKQQINKKKQKLNIDQSQQYQFTQRAHLECLKTQFIFRQIINPLLSTNDLNSGDRNYIELIYLLLARCFNNMSPIQLQLEKRQNNKDIIKNLQDQIHPLYKQVRERFLHFGQKLTQKQNNWYSVVGDFFKKKMHKVQFQEKDRFLTGIEVINYTKQEQIEYTFNFYSSQMKAKIMNIMSLSNACKKLNKFIEINNITQQQINNKRKPFIQVVKDILT